MGLFTVLTTARNYRWDSQRILRESSTQIPLQFYGRWHLISLGTFESLIFYCYGLMNVLLGERWHISVVNLPFPTFWQFKRFETKPHYLWCNQFQQHLISTEGLHFPDYVLRWFFISKTNWLPQETTVHFLQNALFPGFSGLCREIKFCNPSPHNKSVQKWCCSFCWKMVSFSTQNWYEKFALPNEHCVLNLSNPLSWHK